MKTSEGIEKKNPMNRRNIVRRDSPSENIFIKYIYIDLSKSYGKMNSQKSKEKTTFNTVSITV